MSIFPVTNLPQNIQIFKDGTGSVKKDFLALHFINVIK